MAEEMIHLPRTRDTLALRHHRGKRSRPLLKLKDGRRGSGLAWRAVLPLDTVLAHGQIETMSQGTSVVPGRTLRTRLHRQVGGLKGMGQVIQAITPREGGTVMSQEHILAQDLVGQDVGSSSNSMA